MSDFSLILDISSRVAVPYLKILKGIPAKNMKRLYTVTGKNVVVINYVIRFPKIFLSIKQKNSKVAKYNFSNRKIWPFMLFINGVAASMINAQTCCAIPTIILLMTPEISTCIFLSDFQLCYLLEIQFWRYNLQHVSLDSYLDVMDAHSFSETDQVF